jgi:uncharacterized membrane protein YtjA (UPF0391 family)
MRAMRHNSDEAPPRPSETSNLFQSWQPFPQKAAAGLPWFLGLSPMNGSKEGLILYWAMVFFLVAIIASGLGFGDVAAAAGGIAQILFFVFLGLFLIMLVRALLGQRHPPPT